MIEVKDQLLNKAIEELKQYVSLDFSIKITAEPTRTNGYKITKNENGIKIEYSKRHTFFMALKEIMIGIYEAEKCLKTERVGVLFDCARNAVMNVKTIKKYIVYLALIGYNYIKLYVEDCLKIDGEPYFGYMRGAYTKEEIKEIDSFATLFGVELVPCIQTLAHYNQLFLHQDYLEIRDRDDILLIGADRTYDLIENIFKTVSECFSSRNINIGMDEAHSVGRGKYCDLNGYASPNSLFFTHLEKVLKISKKYGFTPYMWSDMVFSNYFNGQYWVKEGNFSEEYLKTVPKDVNYIFWDYYHTEKDKEIYNNMFRLHKQVSNKLCFAGAVWTWRGFAPYNEFTELTMFPALEAAMEYNVNDIFFTFWGDNGGECSRFSILSSLVVLMEKLTDKAVDYEKVTKITEFLTGYSYEDFKLLDLPNQLSGKPVETNTNPCKYLFYADPLIALFDDFVKEGFEKKYDQYATKLFALAEKNERYGYIFNTLATLCKVLSVKAELSIKLKKAYDEKDKEWLAALVDRIQRATEFTKDFYKAYKKQWYIENKSIGFEVSDIRIGGVMQRLMHVQEMIQDYIDGKIDRVEELEEERRSLQIGKSQNEVSVIYNDYRTTVTAGIL